MTIKSDVLRAIRISVPDSPNRSVYATILTRLRTNFNLIIFLMLWLFRMWDDTLRTLSVCINTFFFIIIHFKLQCYILLLIQKYIHKQVHFMILLHLLSPLEPFPLPIRNSILVLSNSTCQNFYTCLQN